MKDRFPVIVLAVFTALCLCGCGVIYVVGMDSTVEGRLGPDGTVTFEIGGLLPNEYSYMTLDNVHPFDSIVFYYDETYQCDEDTSWEEASLLYDTMERMLGSRCYDPFSKVDADGLVDFLSDTGSASSAALIVTSGALPDTVHTENGYPLLEEWMSRGGVLYWMGGNPCSRYSTPSEINSCSGMFTESLFNQTVSDKGATDCSRVAEIFGFGYTGITHGIRADVPGSVVIGLSDGTYSSMSEVRTPFGGKAVIIGDYPPSMVFEQCSAFCDMLVCGATGDTVVVSQGSGQKGYGGMTGTLEVGDCELLFFRVGKPVTDCGFTIVL